MAVQNTGIALWDGLESVKKTHQVARVGKDAIQAGYRRFGQRYVPISDKSTSAGAPPASFTATHRYRSDFGPDRLDLTRLKFDQFRFNQIGIYQ
jgi:hypothetical protein